MTVCECCNELCDGIGPYCLECRLEFDCEIYGTGFMNISEGPDGAINIKRIDPNGIFKTGGLPVEKE